MSLAGAEFDAAEGQAHGFSVLATGLAFPEGPAFDPFGNLWCVEFAAGILWRRASTG